MCRGHVTGTVEEGTKDNFGRVGERKEGTDTGDNQQDNLARRSNGCVLKGGEHTLLGHEAEERRHRCHRCRSNKHGAKGPWHLIPQHAKTADVTGASLVINHADEHEDGGLKQGVRQGVNQCRGNGKGSAHTNSGHNPPQVRHRGIRRELLEVGLLYGEHCRHDGSSHTGDDEQPVPGSHVMEDGREANEQVDTSLDDGRRMQEGRHRRRRSHGLRQPEVERELCRLGEGRKRDEHGHTSGQARALCPHIRGEDVLKVRGPRCRCSNSNTGQQRQATDKGENQRALRTRLARFAAARNEHEGRQRDKLPGKEEHDDVVSQHQQQDRQRERRHQHVETDVSFAFGQIGCGIAKHHRADDECQHGEENTQCIATEGEVDVNTRRDDIANPGHGVGQFFAAGKGRKFSR